MKTIITVVVERKKSTQTKKKKARKDSRSIFVQKDYTFQLHENFQARADPFKISSLVLGYKEK